jgi:hypothetical protein
MDHIARQLVSSHWAAEQETLPEVAAHPLQLFELSGSFDAFSRKMLIFTQN